ncbi:MAG: hypothetical protein ACKOPM_10930 [Novosphingobium sp.]
MTAPSSEPYPQPRPVIRVLSELLLIAVTIPGVFWLGYGRVDGFAIGFAAFLVLLAAAVEYLPALTERVAAQQAADGVVARPAQWFDILGVGWLLAIPFAPLLGWITRSVIDLDRNNWHWWLGLSTLLCVVVPLVCVLPLLRFVRRGSAGIALAILAVGTGFPVATGAGSAYDYVLGPQWQAVTIVRLDDFRFRTKAGTQVEAEDVFVELADGRSLSRATGVVLQPGPAQVLVLRGIGRVIGAEPGSNGPVRPALDPLAESP